MTLLIVTATGSAGGQTSGVGISGIANGGRGTVTSSPGGINCDVIGQAATGACSAPFTNGSVLTLTATPAANNTFGGWGILSQSGQCPASSLTCQFTVGQPNTGLVDVRFTPERYSLTIVGAGNGIGTVEGSTMNGPWYGIGGLACKIVAGVASGTCTTQYAAGLKIELRFNNSGTNTASGVIYGPPCQPGSGCIMPAAPTTIVATVSSPGFRIVSAGGPGTGRVVAISGDAVIDCAVSLTGVTGACYKDYGLKQQTQPVTLQATPSPGSTFLGWSGACSGTGTCVYSVSGLDIKEYVANFGSTTATLSVSGSGTGSGTVVSAPSGVSCAVAAGSTSGTCGATFATGTAISLQATPNAGSAFTGWTGGGCSGTGGCNVIMSAGQSVTAQFTAFTPTVAVTGVGSGSVSSTPAGLSCTITNGATSGTCTSPFAYGTDLTLTATPAAGWGFSGWSGACTGTGTCKPDVTANRSVTASFVQATMALTVTGAGTGNGVVKSSPGGVNCVVTKGSGTEPGCSGVVVEGASVTLTADPQGGSVFGGWSGDGCSGTALTCTLTVSQPRNVVARFTAPRAGRDIALTMLGGGTLAADEREQLDRFGNKDGVFNLGDLLALLDRTGERLTAATTIALVETDRRSSATPTTPQRRTP